MPESKPRILIVEDHALLNESLALALRLEGFDRITVLDPGGRSFEDILEVAGRFRPHVVLLDLHLGPRGLSVPIIAPLKKTGARVIMLTAETDRMRLASCFEAGADGVFDKAQPFSQLMRYVADAADGRIMTQPATREEFLADLRTYRNVERDMMAAFERLTDREAAVLTAIINGKTAEEIAAEEYIAVSTVRSHIRAVLDKLGVNSQLAAVALARRASWPRVTEESA